MPESATLDYCAIVTTFRRPEWLAESLAGIAAQTLPPRRVIVVDDGSGGEFVRQNRELAEQFGFEFIAAPHSGMPGVSRDHGLTYSDAGWIALCDDDDVWEPEHIAQLATRITEDAVVVSANGWRSDGSGPFRPTAPDPVPLLHWFPSNPVLNSATLVRRSTLLAVGGFCATPRGAEDYATWLRMATLGRIVMDDRQSIMYRISGTSLGDHVAGVKRPVELLCGLDFLVWYGTQKLSLRPFVNRVCNKVVQTVIRGLLHTRGQR